MGYTFCGQELVIFWKASIEGALISMELHCLGSALRIFAEPASDLLADACKPAPILPRPDGQLASRNSLSKECLQEDFSTARFTPAAEIYVSCFLADSKRSLGRDSSALARMGRTIESNNN